MVSSERKNKLLKFAYLKNSLYICPSFMTHYIKNIQPSVKKCPNYLEQPNNCVNTHK
ncbi:hypothetical protein M949_0520 [Riemerella anatipestifer CH3]|nr:hypothetical protein M949_0520 [Riemerella anatipestifer CH3]